MSFASFLAGITIVSSLGVFMDAHSFFADGDVSRARIDPSTRIVVADTILLLLHSCMGMAAKNSLHTVGTRVNESA